jgi:hypothetical protein
VLGLIVGLGGWELYTLRRDRRRSDGQAEPQEPPQVEPPDESMGAAKASEHDAGPR